MMLRMIKEVKLIDSACLLFEDHGIVLTISLYHFVYIRNEKQRDIYNSIHSFLIRPATTATLRN